jgi:hypothetical protein
MTLGEDLLPVTLVVLACPLPLPRCRTERVPLPPVTDVPAPSDGLPIPPVLLGAMQATVPGPAVRPVVRPVVAPLCFAPAAPRAIPLPATVATVRPEGPAAQGAARAGPHPDRSPQALNSAHFVQIPALTPTAFTARIRTGERRSVGACSNSPAPPSPSRPPPASRTDQAPTPPRPRRGRERVFRFRLPPGWDGADATGPGATTHAARGARGPRSRGARPGWPSILPAGSASSGTPSRTPPTWDDVPTRPPRGRRRVLDRSWPLVDTRAPEAPREGSQHRDPRFLRRAVAPTSSGRRRRRGPRATWRAVRPELPARRGEGDARPG